MPVDIPTRTSSTPRSRKQFTTDPGARYLSTNPGEMDATAAAAAPLVVLIRSTPILLAPFYLPAWLHPSPWAPQPLEVGISMRDHKPLPKYRRPFINLSQNDTVMNPSQHTQVPHAFAPAIRRYTPYARVMASAAPISLTVRGRDVPRNKCGVHQVASVTSTRLDIIDTDSLLSFAASHPIIPMMSPGPVSSFQSHPRRNQTDHVASTPGGSVQDRGQDGEAYSEHPISEKNGGEESEAQ